MTEQESFLTHWSKRTWFKAVWTGGILALVIFVEVSIARSEDAFNLNGTIGIMAFGIGLFIWAFGCGVIALVAWFVDGIVRKPLRMPRKR